MDGAHVSVADPQHGRQRGRGDAGDMDQPRLQHPPFANGPGCNSLLCVPVRESAAAGAVLRRYAAGTHSHAVRGAPFLGLWPCRRRPAAGLPNLLPPHRRRLHADQLPPLRAGIPFRVHTDARLQSAHGSRGPAGHPHPSLAPLRLRHSIRCIGRAWWWHGSFSTPPTW